MAEIINVTRSSFGKKRYHSRFQFLLNHLKAGNILDVGNVGGLFGQGKFNSFHLKLKETVADSSVVYGFDLYLPEDREKYPNQKQGNIEDGLPYQDGFFDTVYMGELLEHLGNPLFAIEEVRRVLTGDGRLILDVPNPYYLMKIFNYILFAETRGSDPTHIIFYTPSSLTALLNKGGFLIKEFNFKLPVHFRFLPHFLKRILGSHLLVLAVKK